MTKKGKGVIRGNQAYNHPKNAPVKPGYVEKGYNPAPQNRPVKPVITPAPPPKKDSSN
jgi:hypothetical protein